MAPRSSRDYVLASAKNVPFALDGPRDHHHTKKRRRRLDHFGKTGKKNAMQTRTPSNTEGKSSASSSNSDNEPAGEASQGDAADGDSQDDADSDRNAIAPSGYAIHERINQTGPIDEGRFIEGVVDRSKVEYMPIDTDSRSHFIKPNETPAHENKDPAEDSQSNDDDYNALDSITDSEEDGKAIEQLEESNIIASAEKDGKFPIEVCTQTNYVDDSSEWGGCEPENGLLPPGTDFANEPNPCTEIISMFDNELEPTTTSGVLNAFNSPLPRPPAFFPDYEYSEADFRDLNNWAGPSALETDAADDDSVVDGGENDSSGDSSGYESDLGSTTEDDPISQPPQSPNRSSSRFSLDAATSRPSRGLSPMNRHGAPSKNCAMPGAGSFTQNPTKSIAVADNTGRVRIYDARQTLQDSSVFGPASTGTSTPHTPCHISRPDIAQTPSSVLHSYVPTMPAAGETNFSGFSTPAAPVNSMPGIALDIPPVSFFSTLLDTQSMASYYDSLQPVFLPEDSFDPTDYRQGINNEIDGMDEMDYEEFIKFDTSSEDDNSSSDESSALQYREHLGNDKIGAWRRSQSRPNSKSHAIKAGRQAAANASLSPQMKRKRSESNEANPAVGKPAKKRMLNH